MQYLVRQDTAVSMDTFKSESFRCVPAGDGDGNFIAKAQAHKHGKLTNNRRRPKLTVPTNNLISGDGVRNARDSLENSLFDRIIPATPKTPAYKQQHLIPDPKYLQPKPYIVDRNGGPVQLVSMVQRSPSSVSNFKDNSKSMNQGQGTSKSEASLLDPKNTSSINRKGSVSSLRSFGGGNPSLQSRFGLGFDDMRKSFRRGVNKIMSDGRKS